MFLPRTHFARNRYGLETKKIDEGLAWAAASLGNALAAAADRAAVIAVMAGRFMPIARLTEGWKPIAVAENGDLLA